MRRPCLRSALLLLVSLCPTAAYAQVVMAPGGGQPVLRVLNPDGSESTFLAYPAGFTGGVRVALGDVNGDGIVDIVTGAGPSGGPHVQVFSGADHSVLASFYAYDPAFTGGIFVAAGDVDGDGRADIITGAGPGGGPHVRVFSGADLSELASFYAYAPAFTGGIFVAAGDVNGDGLADIITGAGPGGGPHVRVFSGTDLSDLASFYAYGPSFPGGVSVASLDVNGDGLADIITGAGPGGGPHVRVFSGADLSELASFYAYDPLFPGGVSVGAADFDGDGQPELVTGAGPGGGPHVRIFRTSDFAELGSFYAFDPSFTGGVFIGSLPGASAGLRFTSATSTSFTVGSAGTFSITTAGASGAITVTETGSLPGGVTFTDNGDGTATLAGTPGAGTGGSYALTFTADNGSGTPATQTFTLTVNQAPAITSAAVTTFPVGAPGTFAVTTTGFPVPTITRTGATPPAGVTWVDNGNGTGTLSGTPAAGTAGTYTLTFTASNGTDPVAVQTFTLTVNDAPGFTSATSTTFTVGSLGTFTVTTVGTPTASITATALPGGVTFTDNGNGTGTLSGTPDAGTAGAHAITFTATNSSGTTTQSFTLNVHQAPAITSAASTTFSIGAAGSFTVTTSGFPAATLAIGGAALPSNLQFVDNGDGTGTLSGTPAAGTGGAYAITFTATNAAGTSAPQAFTLTVSLGPTITSLNATTFTVGSAGTFTITTTGFPLPTITTMGGLPAGVGFTNNGNGTATLSGTPDPGTTGVYPITITAANGVLPNATQGFTLTVNEGPAITSANSATFTTGVAGSFTVTTSGVPAPTVTIGGVPLPATLMFADNGNGTGTLSGTAAAGTEGTYALTFTATNSVGSSAPQAFTLSVITLLPPTLDPIADPAPILENAGLQTVNLTGITAGGSETQPLQVTATSDTPALIPTPTVSYTSPNATGSLTYTPVANAFGTAIVTVTVTDGGLDNNLATPGDNGTFSRQFTVTVTGVNDAPTLDAIPDPAPIAEDAGAQTVNLTGITAGTGESTQLLQVTALSNNTGLIPNPTVTYTSPAATGSLSYTPVADASGSAIITVTVTDGGLDNNLGTPGDNGTVSRTFTVVVSTDNDPPTLDAIPDPAAILEDAGAQSVTLSGISAGGGETQVLTVTAISNNVALIPNPTVTYTSPNATGSLAYTPVANAFGTAIVTVRVTDDGTAFVERTFTVTVTPVNDAPSFTAGANQTVLEDAGPQTVVAWATAISAGPGEAGQVVTFQVTNNTNAALFLAGPAVDASGTLTYTAAAGASGTATITLVLGDDGGTASGGVSQSAPQVFTITVTAVNDTPTLDAIPNPAAILEDAGLQTVNLSGISAGPGESAQPLQVTASSNNTGLIPNPTVTYTSPAATGSLSYTPVANASGSAVVTVTVTDGGNDNNLATPGDNGSVVRTFTVTVTAVNDPPAITAGGTLNFTEGNPATAINTTILVTDADSPNLAFATVQITGNYVNGQDVLAFTPAFGIVGLFVPATGTLTLSGNNPVANYQAALRTVTYFNNSASPSIAPRTVAWVVNDGTVSSNIATSTITVTAVNSAPIGVADAWTTFGNTELVVDQAGPATPFVTDTTPSTFGVLANDTDPEGDPRVVTGIVGCADTTAPFVCTTTAGGSVTMESNGKFTYRPQAGDTGADSFQYVLTDVPSAGVPGSVNVTVNLTLQERIWYVDGGVAGPGTGTSNDPFNALPATIGDADDFIFVHDSTVSGAITLQNGQKLYGEGFGLSINQALNGNPAPVVLVAPGNNPVINATTGNAVGVLANTASGNLTNVEIRGLTLSTSAASSNAIDVTSANAANVAVTISDVEVTGATAEGIDINQASTGTATVSISNVTVTSTGTGIDLNETAGTLTVTGFSGITITGATAGAGIVISGATFDGTAGGAYQQVAGGTTVVGSQADPVGGAGIVMTNVSGDLGFTDLDIFTSNGPGLQVTGTGTLNGGAGTGMGVAVAAGVATLQSVGGPVVNINNATATLPLDSATVTSSLLTGINLSGASGTISATSGSITNTTGISVNVQGGTVSLNYGGNITQTNNVAMVSVSGGHTTGAIAFSGTLNATNGTGLQFDNADSTYNFTGTTTLNGGDAGIDILNGSAGTFTFGTGTTITNPSGTAFLLSGSNANVTYSGSISDNTGFAVDISGHAAGTVTFQTGSITSTGNGLQVSNNTGGAINFNSPTIALTTGANKAVTLDVGNTGGTINFAPAGGNGLDISTTTGTGFSALGGGTISVSGAGNSINTTGAMAIELQGATIGAGGVNFATTTSGGGTRNVKLTSVTGGAVALGGGTLTGATGAAFLVGDGAGGANSGGTAPISYAGTISATGAARTVDIQDRAASAGNITLSGTLSHSGNGNGVFMDQNAAGTIAFTAANSVLNGGTSTAVSLTNNTGATISFTGGGLDIDSTTGTGFLATGGGTVTVQGASNTIVANGSGTALNIANTTIGASDVTFQSISAGTAAGSAGNGMVLDTTGASGGLHVTGTGTAGSGGTIQHKTGSDGATTSGIGIYLNSTADVQLAWMQLNDFQNFGIRGNDVTGFTFDNSVLSGTNGTTAGASDEAAISFNNLLGSASISNSNVSNGFEYILKVLNNGGTLNRLTVNNTDFGTNNTTLGGDAFQIVASNAATVNVTVTDSTFTNAREDLFNAAVTQTADMDLVFRGNTLSNNHTNKVSAASNLLLFSTSIGDVTYDLSHNTLTTGATGSAIAAAKGVPDSGSGGTMVGTINANTVGVAGVVGSGSEFTGIFASALGSGTHTTAITNNVVRHYNEEGIFLKSNDPLTGGNAILNATLTGNQTLEPDSLAFAGLWLVAGSGSGTETHTVNVVLGNISTSPVAASPTGSLQNDFTAGDPANGSDVFLQESGSGSVINLSRAGSVSGTAAGVVQDDNVGTPTVVATGTINLVSSLPTSPPPVAP